MLLIPLFITGVTDLRYRRIPDWQVILIFIIGISFYDCRTIERIAGFICPSFPLFCIALNNHEIKGGDIKYISALGAVIGIYALAEVIFYVLCISFLYMLISKKKRIPLAFVGFIGYVCRILSYLN